MKNQGKAIILLMISVTILIGLLSILIITFFL